MIPELYLIYVAIVFQVFLYGVLLKVFDVKKDGGDWRDAITILKNTKNKIANVNNDDVIEEEDADVTSERNAVADYISNR